MLVAKETLVTFPGSEQWPEVRKSRGIILRAHEGATAEQRQNLSAYDLLLVKVASCYALPGGSCEGNETSLETAQREVEEEVGARAEPGVVFKSLEALSADQVTPAFTLRHFQASYRSIDAPRPVDRIVETDFWFLRLVDDDPRHFRPHPTACEEFYGLSCGYYSLAEIQELLHPDTCYCSARRIYFNDELRAVIQRLTVMLEQANQRARLTMLP